MKWDVPDDLPLAVANADGVVEDCGICGGRHLHGSASPDSEFQRAGVLGPGYFYVNNPTRASSCPSDEYEGDYLLVYGMGEDHPYVDGSDKREAPELRNHDSYKEDYWKVLDVDSVDKVFSTSVSDERVRVDLDGHAAPSGMRDLANEGDNVNISVWLSLEYAEELVDHLSEAIEESGE